MIHFSLLPLDTIGSKRGPAYLKWRYRDGLDCRWSLKDMGNIGLVASDAPIPQALPIESKQRVCNYLKSNGIEHRWIAKAGNQRELLHRIAGIALSYQADSDKPDLWLHKDVHFGFTTLQAIKPKVNHIVLPAPHLNARDNFKPSFNWRGLLASLALLPFAALPASDAFTAADGTNLTTYSANWTYNTASSVFQINSNGLVTAQAAFEGAAFWNADTPNTDHYTEATVAAIGLGDYIGLSVRNGASTAQTFYDYISDSGDGSYLGKYNAGVYTQLGTTGAVFTTSLAIRLEANGTSIRPMRAGVTADIGAQTDAALSNQRFGVAGYDTGILSRIDDWVGNNLVTATKAKPIFQRKNQVWKRSF